MASRRRSAALDALALLGLALGLWVSFRYTFAAWQPDPDILVTVALWRGVHQYGMRFLQSWSYTQGNCWAKRKEMAKSGLRTDGVGDG
jgi:hypothetical protein